MRTKLSIINGDITLMETDAIVNAANSSLLGGGGVDGAIHRAAGNKLIEECRALGGCPTGEAKITSGYNLKAKYVIHTVGPVWRGGNNNEAGMLSNCYKNSLKAALAKGIKTIAFPSISTGAYGFPLEKGAQTAINSVKEFLYENDSFDEIIFVCFGQNAFDIYNRVLFPD